MPIISVVIATHPVLGRDEVDRSLDCWMQTAREEVEVITSESDEPYAVNVNAGLALAEGDLVVVADSDVLALPGWCTEIRERSEAGDVGIISFTPSPACDWAFGIRRDVLDKTGLFDVGLVDGYEAHDLFLRCALLGRRRSLCSRVLALQEGGSTRTLTATAADGEVRLKQILQNRAFMAEKWPGIDIDAVMTSSWVARERVSLANWRANRLDRS